MPCFQVTISRKQNSARASRSHDFISTQIWLYPPPMTEPTLRHCGGGARSPQFPGYANGVHESNLTFMYKV